MIQQQQQLLLLLWTAIFGRRRRDFTQEITAINMEFFRDESHMALTFYHPQTASILSKRMNGLS